MLTDSLSPYRFLNHDHKPKLASEFLPKAVVEEFKRENEESASGDAEPPKKKAKLKGRNKRRPMEPRVANEDKLCPHILSEKECRFGESCKFSHDVKKYIETKPADLGDECYAFKTFGKCNYGLACRFAKSHLTKDFKNVVNEEVYSKCKDKEVVTNILSKEAQFKLRKRTYDFKRALDIVKRVQNKSKKSERKEKGSGPNEDVSSTSDKSMNGVETEASADEVKKVDDESEGEIRLPQREKKTVSQKSFFSTIQILMQISGELFCLICRLTSVISFTWLH